MLNKLRALFGYERKESRAFSALIQLGLDQVAWTPRDYENLTRVGYQMNADVYACVNLIARSAKQVPWLVTKSEGGAAVGNNHPLLKLLRAPNERDTESDFKEAAIAYLLLSGNEYIERSGGTETTPPAFLYAHRPDRFRIIKGKRRLIVAGYQYTAVAPPVAFQEWEILHLRLFNPLDDYYGMSPLEAAAYTIDNSNESAALYKKLLQKGYPPGAVTVKGVDYTDEQLRDLKMGLRRSAEQGDILVLQDAEWQEMGFAPIDASIFEGKLFQKRDIAAVYGVPSGMIGDTQVKTYANSREERRSLYTEAVIPALTKLRDGLNNWLGPLYDGAFIDIDKDAIDALAEDRETQATRVVALFEKGLIKRSEGREELKYDAIPEDEDGYYADVAKPISQPALPAGGQDPNQRRLNPPDMADAPASEKPAANGRVVPIRRGDEGVGRYYKAFGLLSEEQKTSFWQASDDHRELWTARIAAQVEDRFLSERDAVIKAYVDNGETAAIRAVTRQEQAWGKLYNNIVISVAEDFGRRTVQSIKSDGYTEIEVKFEMDIFTKTIFHWLATEGAKRVVAVLEYTKAQIRKELAVGVSQGESIYQLSKRLQAMYSDFSNVRAERIARTETQTAASLGSQTAAKATNLPLTKEWIATKDDRTRDAHWTANGQVQKLDQPYLVEGWSMMYPGDSTLGAPASLIVQCRCAEAYSISRG